MTDINNNDNDETKAEMIERHRLEAFELIEKQKEEIAAIDPLFAARRALREERRAERRAKRISGKGKILQEPTENS